jgi:hypothetical protein
MPSTSPPSWVRRETPIVSSTPPPRLPLAASLISPRVSFSGDFAALLDATPESLTGAPASVSERVALRCLQELSAAASTGDGPTASRAPAGVLRVDITRSCEDLLLQIIGKVMTGLWCCSSPFP